MIVVADPHTLVHSRRWAAWLAWVEKAGAVPGERNWRMPSRPSRYRDASSDESDEDAMGRRIAKRRGDDDSDSDDERAQVVAQRVQPCAMRAAQGYPVQHKAAPLLCERGCAPTLQVAAQAK